MVDNQFLLYGANGYTARLIIDRAASFGLTPVLAGRSEEKLRPLAERYGLSYRVADLANTDELDKALRAIPVVLHCAGPFSQTAGPMQRACLRIGTHYLDITGEVAVFEQGKARDTDAKTRNLMLMSGVGFDVVPTDCIARYLHDHLPDATHLQLAFMNEGGGLSHGTAQTALEGMSNGGLVRQNGVLKPVPNAHKTLTVDFGTGQPQLCMSISWGDLATAYYTTSIPSIETFIGSSTRQIKLAKWGTRLSGVLALKPVQSFLRKQITSRIDGPDEATRQRARTHVWGRVWNARGQTTEARLHGPEGYTLTVESALLITRKVLQGHWQAGFQTPAGLYGADLVLEIPGVTRI